MTVWSYAQLEGIWINNGGLAAMAPLMAAIAMVESGGNDQAVNASGATGLWQIEWPLHAGIVACAVSKSALLDPNCNAKAAIALSGNVNSAAPGSPVYDNWIEDEPPNAYKAFLNGSTTPDTSAGGGAQAQTTAATQDCLLNLPSVGVLGITLAGGQCVLNNGQGRAVLGALVMGAGAVPVMLGLVILAAFAFRRPAVRSVGQAVTTVRALPFVP